MSDPRNTHGAFCWTELMTTDPEAAETFYGELFGWTMKSMTVQDGQAYTVISVGDRQEGGIMAMARNIRHLRLILVTECGHWVMVEHEGMFNRACLDFLQHG